VRPMTIDPQPQTAPVSPAILECRSRRAPRLAFGHDRRRSSPGSHESASGAIRYAANIPPLGRMRKRFLDSVDRYRRVLSTLFFAKSST
jgi:hypothetical protein